MDHKKVNTLFNYIGGKGWLRNDLRIEMASILNDNSLTTYVEPFAGGLGAFLNVYDLLLSCNIKNVILNDLNRHLINFYTIVKENPEQLIKNYMMLENEFSKTISAEAFALHKTKEKIELKLLLKEAEDFFKKVRGNFNNSVETVIGEDFNTASHLLFLQNHCFNGVYRENGKGYYNTPFNWEAKVFTEDKLRIKILNVHDIFNQFNMVIKYGSFDNLEYNNSSIYYLDPPYLNEEIGENKYNKDIFDIKQQASLISKIKDTNFIYSNHKAKFLENEFKNKIPNAIIREIARKNIISASAESRKNDKIEILITHKL